LPRKKGQTGQRKNPASAAPANPTRRAKIVSTTKRKKRRESKEAEKKEKEKDLGRSTQFQVHEMRRLTHLRKDSMRAERTEASREKEKGQDEDGKAHRFGAAPGGRQSRERGGRGWS